MTRETQRGWSAPSGAGSGAQVVVVGAGVIGAAAAYRVAAAGARVTLVDRGAPGAGTSANSFAWVNANAKEPYAYYRLNWESMTAHRRLRDDVRAAGVASDWLHEGGGLEIATTKASADRLLAKAARLREWGYRIEIIDERAVRELEPHLSTAGFVAATICPDEAWLDARLFCGQVVDAARSLGVGVRTGVEVVAVSRQGDRIGGVELSTGERIHADHVVVAAGRWTDRVAALAGVHVPLVPTCGLLAVTAPFAQRVNRVVHVPGMNFRPDPSGGLVLQSGETDALVTADTAPDPRQPGCARLLGRVQQHVPAAGLTHIAAARVGVRPMPADGVSIVGPVAQRRGLYLAVTHSGVTLAPRLAELIAAEIITGQQEPGLEGFRPDRCVTVGDG